MSMKILAVLVLSAGVGLAAAGAAAQQSGMSQGDMADGVIRKVDKDAGKLTIKHGPIPSMDMPPMTMVYRVIEPAMLDAVQAGDRVRFDARKTGGAYVVTRIERAN